MLENEPTNPSDNSTAGESAGSAAPRRKRTTTKKSAPVAVAATKPVPVKGRRPAKKTAAAPVSTHAEPAAESAVPAAKKAAAKRSPRKAAKATAASDQHSPDADGAPSRPAPVPTVLFQPPSAENAVPASRARRSGQRQPSGSPEASSASGDAGSHTRSDEYVADRFG